MLANQDVSPSTPTSTSFPPHRLIDLMPPSLDLVSSDSVHFYVHSHILKGVSMNEFNGLLSLGSSSDVQYDSPSSGSRSIPMKPMPMNTDTLNVVLHAAYRASFAQFTPSLDTVVEAVDLLPAYGIPPSTCIYSSSGSADASPLYTLLLSMAAAHPLPIYTLAAHHSLDDLAVASSEHLLSTPLHVVLDQVALRMGPVYYKRLSFLLLGRVQALKTLVSAPPSPHMPTPSCSAEEQIKFAQDWASAAASFLWDAQADIPTASIEASLRPLGTLTQCSLCKRALSNRIEEVFTQWPNVKRTI